ncbi:hypothetical protein ACFSGX_00625 [Sphingomonas arantia]|uniref:Lipoprotein n=1 Tax=Sphingomonas arantia TaxID=1460676 RepID=A0ABW4TUL9_9SPHN
MTPGSSSLAAAIACLALSGCSGGPSRDGIFNNIDDYDLAIRRHEAAWLAALGQNPTVSRIDQVVRDQGGSCSAGDSGGFSCAAVVKPRWPSVFTLAIQWTLAFERRENGRVSAVRADRTKLGWDL